MPRPSIPRAARDSDRRVVCPVADRCGGCALIGRPYEAQLETKREELRRALSAASDELAGTVEPCVPAPRRRGYRGRAKLAAFARRRGVVLGLYERGGHHVVDLAPCKVQDPGLVAAMESLRSWLEAYELVHPRGPVFYVDLRLARRSSVHATLVVDEEAPTPRPELLRRLVDEIPEIAGLALNRGRRSSSYPMGATSDPIAGESVFRTALDAGSATLDLEVPPGAFFQVSTDLLPAIHDAMHAHLAPAPGERLIDLYCGVGVHGLALAARTPGLEIAGVELAPEAVAAAERNARRHAVDARYVAGPVEDETSRLLRQSGVDHVILNPARAGCRPGVIDALVESGPARLAYLSCRPSTLARDLAALAPAYRVERVVPYDLLPQTDHVEALALLTRAETEGRR